MTVYCYGSDFHSFIFYYRDSHSMFLFCYVEVFNTKSWTTMRSCTLSQNYLQHLYPILLELTLSILLFNIFYINFFLILITVSSRFQIFHWSRSTDTRCFPVSNHVSSCQLPVHNRRGFLCSDLYSTSNMRLADDR